MPVFPAVSVRVPATSANLGPGFDALGLALTLYNELSLEIAETDSLTVSGEGTAELAGQTHTIAHFSARRVFEILEVQISGIHLKLRNAIPLSRGLGSSSAAIVGGLVAANEWARNQQKRVLSRQQLLDLATEIEGHPDNVAPALLGGLVVAAISENGAVSSVQVPIPTFPRLAVWIPDAELATKTARGVLPTQYSRADAIFNVSRAALLVGALAAGDFSVLGEALRDKIHQDYRAPLVPGFETISRAAKQSGALGVTLSGAGPSILVWMPENAETILEAIQNAARESGITGRVLPVEVDSVGCHPSSIN